MSAIDNATLTAKRLADVMRIRWLSCLGTIEDARIAGAELGWTEHPVRRGDPVVSDLRAVSKDDAHPSSLSAIVGFDAQPLHTDGAHLIQPPDVIVLASTGPTPTATRILDIDSGSHIPRDALRHGIFSVATSPDRLYATALTAARLRYDPGCMTACDQRARTVVEYFSGAFNDSHRHEWTASDGQLLVVDNRWTLHAREAVQTNEIDRTLQRVAFWI